MSVFADRARSPAATGLIALGGAGGLGLAPIIVPWGTPDPLHAGDPLGLTADQRTARARALLASPALLTASTRTLIGDARDLFAHVVNVRTGRLPFFFTEGGSANAVGGLDRPEPAEIANAPVRVRIGWGSGTQRILREADVVSAFDPATYLSRESLESSLITQDDVTRAIDADGFLALALSVRGRTEIVLIGGSDYGTFFAVAWFLESLLGVRWVLPGPAGEYIPTAVGPLSVDAGRLNRLEEPDIRGRTLYMSRWTLPAADLDDLRDWQLRNRLRPSNDRLHIRQSLDGQFLPCAQPVDSPEMLALEARFPAEHALNQWLSPLQPTTREAIYWGDDRVSQPYLERGFLSMDIYPDVRPRLADGTGVPGIVPTTGRPDFFGARLDARYCIDHVAERRSSSERQAVCLKEYPFRVDRVDPNFAASSADLGVPALSPYGALIQSGLRLTYLPTVAQRTWEGFDVAATTGWAPCVYDEGAALRLPGLPPLVGTALPVPVRSELVDELVPQLGLALWLQAMVGGIDGGVAREAALSLAHVDGIGPAFCHCGGCVYALAISLGRWMYRGVPVLSEWRPLLQLDAGSEVSDPVERDRLTVRGIPVHPRRGELLTNPGVLTSNAISRIPTFSRSVVDLANAVARGLSAGPYDVSTTWAVLSIQAYGDYHGAPIFGPPDRFAEHFRLQPVSVSGPYGPLDEWDRANAVHPLVLVNIAESRDEPEYDGAPHYDAAVAAMAERPPPFTPFSLQERYPAQFNLHRWSMIANRLGFYEYLYGSDYYVPRLYSRRLQSALRVGLRLGVCAFTAECSPSFGMAGPSYWEAAKLLWNPAVEVTDLRLSWAEALVGETGDRARRVAAVWTSLEALWSRKRNKATYRSTTARREGLEMPFPFWRTVLQFADPELPGESTALVLRRSATELLGVERELTSNVTPSRPGAASAVRRVALLRGAVALSAWLAERAAPILRVHRQIRDLLPVPPLELTVGKGATAATVRLVAGPSAPAAEVPTMTLTSLAAVSTTGMGPSSVSTPVPVPDALRTRYVTDPERSAVATDVTRELEALWRAPGGEMFRSGEAFRAGVRLAFHAELARHLPDGVVTVVDGRLVLSSDTALTVNGVETAVLGRHALWFEDLRVYAGFFWNPLRLLSGNATTVVPWNASVQARGEHLGVYFEQLKQMVFDIDSFLRMALPVGDDALANAPFRRDAGSLIRTAETFARG